MLKGFGLFMVYGGCLSVFTTCYSAFFYGVMPLLIMSTQHEFEAEVASISAELVHDSEGLGFRDLNLAALKPYMLKACSEAHSGNHGD